MLKKIQALVAIALIASLAACSPGAPAESPAPAASEADEPAEPVEGESTASEVLGVTESCELFNTMWADYAAVEDGDADGFDDVYLAVEDAIPTVAPETEGLFRAFSLVAIEMAADGALSEETKTTLTDWFFDTSADCTAAGVTLKI